MISLRIRHLIHFVLPLNFIILERDRIEKIGSDLEKISKLRDCLNHPAFGEISTLKQKFEDLRMVHNDQYVMSEKLIADTQALLDTYHNLFSFHIIYLIDRTNLTWFFSFLCDRYVTHLNYSYIGINVL
ncbi:unnamed protein product [Schistosoma mattheei]|uniref:Uncharacterized protein n=1 Tax=Schistosoma mattheei TaxID=31246 RepID=A0A183PX04_9TREM|nr:unnamed protein product [Schistosoma mattheei]